MKYLYFSHGGKLGDIIYSLNFIREMIAFFQTDGARLHLQTEIPLNSVYEPYNKVIMSTAAAECLAPLLRIQPYLLEVSISPQLPDGAFNLHERLKLPLDFFAGNIVDWYYPLFSGILPRNFHDPVLTVSRRDPRASGRIILFRSIRHCNPLLDYGFMKSYVDRIVFLGTPDEHDVFRRRFFDCAYLPTRDYLECAELIAGAKLCVGNQTGLFAIAEQLKVDRVLESCQYREHNGQIAQGCPNVIPTGGRCASIVAQRQFEEVVANFLS